MRGPSSAFPESGSDGLAHGAEPIAASMGVSPALSSEDAGWKNLSLYLWRGHADHCDFVPFGETLAVFHTGGSRDVRIRVGKRWIDDTSMPGRITIVPPATPVSWKIGGGGEVHSCSLHLAHERFRNLTEDGSGDSPLDRLRFRFACDDPLMAASISCLVDELEAPKERGPLFADTLADGVALHILRTCSTQSTVRSRNGGLTRRALNASLDRIEAGLETGVSLDVLATTAGLSRSHFARAFRQSTGKSPHQYLTQRRLVRARELLARSDQPIIEIALRCGFSSQAHFTQSFRQIVGATPLEYRRARR